jgi:hypothetical protein
VPTQHKRIAAIATPLPSTLRALRLGDLTDGKMMTLPLTVALFFFRNTFLVV